MRKILLKKYLICCTILNYRAILSAVIYLELMRISKFISASGITSRRKAEKLVESGRIKVNNIIITDLSYKINPDKDILMLDDTIINYNHNNIYIKLFKPKGYITTLQDELGRKTVFDLIDTKERIFPVGRLDQDTRGLLLLTNDGDFSYKITHPKFEVEKLYRVKIKGIPSQSYIETLEGGIDIGDLKTCQCKIKILSKNNDYSELLIKIHEGKKRQIRKMFDYIGNPVLDLLRLKIGPIGLGNLKEGQWTYLNESELDNINKFLGDRK